MKISTNSIMLIKYRVPNGTAWAVRRVNKGRNVGQLMYIFCRQNMFMFASVHKYLSSDCGKRIKDLEQIGYFDRHKNMIGNF